MEGLSKVLVWAGVVAVVLGVISRFTMKLIPLAPHGVDASGFLQLAGICFLLALVILVQKK